jgi:hypothetical protein
MAPRLLLPTNWTHSLFLKLAALHFSEKRGKCYRIVRRYFLNDKTLHSHSCQSRDENNLVIRVRSRWLLFLFTDILNATPYRQALEVDTTSCSIGVVLLCPGEERQNHKCDPSPSI